MGWKRWAAPVRVISDSRGRIEGHKKQRTGLFRLKKEALGKSPGWEWVNPLPTRLLRFPCSPEDRWAGRGALVQVHPAQKPWCLRREEALEGEVGTDRGVNNQLSPCHHLDPPPNITPWGYIFCPKSRAGGGVIFGGFIAQIFLGFWGL